MAIRIAIIGLGKISVDEHIPAILGNSAFQLVAGVSPHSRVEGVTVYPDLETALAAEDFDAVAVNTHPQLRFELARQALSAGKHVLLEKPPAATVSALADLERLARQKNATLYAAWHSQHAPAVEPAKSWLVDRQIRRVSIRWCENVRKWHPGQRWIWEPGGLGVFDPGINAFSIVTRIIPAHLIIETAQFDVPRNCATPIAAQLVGRVGDGGQFSAVFDFLQLGQETWSIDIESDAGEVSLRTGGRELVISGAQQEIGPSQEYASIYRIFASLVAKRECEVDPAPLALAADAFLIGERREVTDFAW